MKQRQGSREWTTFSFLIWTIPARCVKYPIKVKRLHTYEFSLKIDLKCLNYKCYNDKHIYESDLKSPVSVIEHVMQTEYTNTTKLYNFNL